MATPGIAFVASPAPHAQEALTHLVARHGSAAPADAAYIVALGGDGFMLQTLHATQHLPAPVYGMNRGTMGFLMNSYRPDGLLERLALAERATINPLRMQATTIHGKIYEALAINEVSLLREGPQAAKLRIHVDGQLRMEELVCDGALVATPAGSTAYNYSAHGPILPLGAGALALTAVAAFRPRRWRGALVRIDSTITFEVLSPGKRPVMAVADGRSVRDVLRIEVATDLSIAHTLLFDPGHGLDERLMREQFN